MDIKYLLGLPAVFHNGHFRLGLRTGAACTDAPEKGCVRPLYTVGSRVTDKAIPPSWPFLAGKIEAC